MTYVHFKFKIKALYSYKISTSISGLQIVLPELGLNGLWAEVLGRRCSLSALVQQEVLDGLRQRQGGHAV